MQHLKVAFDAARLTGTLTPALSQREREITGNKPCLLKEKGMPDNKTLSPREKEG